MILRLQQMRLLKLPDFYSNSCLNLFVFIWRTNITFQNVSLSYLRKCFLTQKKKKIVFRGPIKYFESAPRELGRFRDAKWTIFLSPASWVQTTFCSTVKTIQTGIITQQRLANLVFVTGFSIWKTLANSNCLSCWLFTIT